MTSSNRSSFRGKSKFAVPQSRSDGPRKGKPRFDTGRRSEGQSEEPKKFYTPRSEGFKGKPRFDRTRSKDGDRAEGAAFVKPRRDDAFKDKPRYDRTRKDGDRAEGSSFAKPRRDAEFKGRSRRDEPFKGKPRREEGRGGKPPRREKPQFESRRAETAEAPLPLRERDSVLIWGVHAVRAAWLNPKRRCYRLWMTESVASGFESAITEARDTLLLKRPDSKRVERHELDRLTPPGSVHQGIVLEMTALPEPSLHDVIGGDAPPDLIIMLDQVTDPHNVGAILRSAAAFGAGAVIMTERNAPTTTGVLAKSASGALEHVPQIHVVNLARALDELQEAGYWSVGLAEEGEKDLGAHDLTGRTVLVLGAEGEGLRQLTRKKCNEMARLPTGGAIGSLNVSNAAAVALYEVRRQKKAFV